MAVSKRYAYRLLNLWGDIMEVPPYLYNQITGNGIYASLSSPGLGVYVQPDRERIAEGLITAVQKSLPYLRFHYRPTFVRERIQWNGRAPLITKFKEVRAIGKRTTSLIEAGTAVAYTDSDGDGTLDLATITVTVAADTDPAEVKTYFRVADGADIAASQLWEIEPTRVSVVGTTATITAHRSLFVTPSLWRLPYNEPNFNQSSINAGDTADASDFVTLADVYREYPDPAQAAVLLGYGSNAYAEFDIMDARLGILYPSDWCQSLVCNYRGYIDLWYVSGYPLDEITGMPDYNLSAAMVRLANAEMPFGPVDLNFDDERLRRWQNDNRVTTPDQHQNTDILHNPFGIKYGQVNAWNMMKNYAVAHGGRHGT